MEVEGGTISCSLSNLHNLINTDFSGIQVMVNNYSYYRCVNLIRRVGITGDGKSQHNFIHRVNIRLNVSTVIYMQ